MADTRILLAGLKEYRASLQRHLIELRSEFNQLENRWFAFSAVYEGDAADQFRAHWLRTAERFKEYVDRSQQILTILNERIDALEEANRQESGLLPLDSKPRPAFTERGHAERAEPGPEMVERECFSGRNPERGG